MRILAIDHGTHRMGLALSDETGTIAQPLEFFPAEPLEVFARHLAKLIDSKGVAQILVGIPRNMNGTYGPAAEKAREFVAVLKQSVGIPIKTWDERLTSTQANRSLIEMGMRREQRKNKVDQTAAAILLQSYLDNISQ